MFTFSAHVGPVTSVAFAGSAGTLLSTGVDGHVKLWNPLTGENLLDLPAAEPALDTGSAGLLGALADSTGRFAAVGLRSRGVEFIDLESGRDTGWLDLGRLADVVPSPDCQTVFVLGRWDRAAPTRTRLSRPAEVGSVYVWQVGFPDGHEIARARHAGRAEGRVTVAPDASEVLAGSVRYKWPRGTRAGLDLCIGGPANFPRAASHDKDKLFAPSGSRLGVWSYQIGVARHRLKGHVAPITALVVTPDGRKLWTASLDATVRRWDVDTYAMETTYRFPGGPLSCVAVSPDGNLGAAGCAHKGTVTVWDLN
jgi:WD40 repeat protein